MENRRTISRRGKEEEEEEFEHGGEETTVSVRMGRGHDADEDAAFNINPISVGHGRSASLEDVLAGGGVDDRQRDDAHVRVRFFAMTPPLHTRCGGGREQEEGRVDDGERAGGGGGTYSCCVSLLHHIHFFGMTVLLCFRMTYPRLEEQTARPYSLEYQHRPNTLTSQLFLSISSPPGGMLHTIAQVRSHGPPRNRLFPRLRLHDAEHHPTSNPHANRSIDHQEWFRCASP